MNSAAENSCSDLSYEKKHRFLNLLIVVFFFCIFVYFSYIFISQFCTNYWFLSFLIFYCNCSYFFITFIIMIIFFMAIFLSFNFPAASFFSIHIQIYYTFLLFFLIYFLNLYSFCIIIRLLCPSYRLLLLCEWLMLSVFLLADSSNCLFPFLIFFSLVPAFQAEACILWAWWWTADFFRETSHILFIWCF